MFRVQRSLAMCSVRTHMLTKPRRAPTVYDQELRKWRTLTKSVISQHRTDFWVSQTEVENKWLEQYTQKLTKKLTKRHIKAVQNTITLCQRTKEKLDFLNKKDQKQAAKAVARDMKLAEDKKSREKLITALNIDSQTWFTPSNFAEKLQTELMVPNALDTTDYYQDLQINMFKAKEGPLLDSDFLYNNRAETAVRNTLILPMFTEIKGIIRRVTYTEETKLGQDFQVAKAQLTIEQRDDAASALTTLRSKYIKLAAALRKSDQSPDIFIQKAHLQTIWIQDLLVQWNQYITVARLDDRQILVYFNSFDPSGKKKRTGKDQGKSLKTLVPGGEKQEETWEDDFKLGNPEDSDEATDEKPKPVSQVAAEKDKLLESLSSFDPEKLLSPGEGAAAISEVPGFDMYSGKPSHPKSGLYDPEAQKSLQDLMDLMFKELTDKHQDPADLFDSVDQIHSSEHLLKPLPDKEFNPSFVLDRIRKQLKDISEENLSVQLRWKKIELEKALDAIESVRVIEPRLLYRVFQFHRYDPPRFKLD